MDLPKKTIDLAELISSPEELSPVAYQYYKNLANRRIILNEEVTSSLVETVILPLLEMDSDGSGKPIEIILSTPGGTIFDGLVLCDIIDRLKTPTTIRVLGYAYSMGGVFLLAGFNNPNVKKVCYPFSTALLHGGETYLSGSSNSVKDTFKFHDKMESKIKDYILSHSKITADEYEKMERTEWYMTSEDMLRLGLVDEIL